MGTGPSPGCPQEMLPPDQQPCAQGESSPALRVPNWILLALLLACCNFEKSQRYG